MREHAEGPEAVGPDVRAGASADRTTATETLAGASTGLLQPGAMALLQRQAGNRAVSSLIAAPPTETTVQRSCGIDLGGGTLSDEAIAALRQRLVSWGIDDPGDLNTLRQETVVGTRARIARAQTRGESLPSFGPLAPADIHHAMHLIDVLKEGGGRYGGRRGPRPRGGFYPGRIIAAWNRELDDLGPQATADRGRYATILHYVLHIDRTTQAQMGVGYLEAANAMPEVRLAGAVIRGVNPRALYFTAAAQAEMDVRSQTRHGQGHYVAAGAMTLELRDMRRMLGPLRRRPRRPDPTTQHLGVQAVNVILSRVEQVLDVMQLQAGEQPDHPTPGYERGEHAEPALRDWIRGRANRIQALSPARTPQDVAALATALNGVLEGLPVSERHHGAGSVDPHGTDHALGLAIDLFNGVRSSTQNMGIRDEHWPFIYAMIDQLGPRYGLTPGMRPTAIHRLPPEQARALGRMINENADTFEPPVPESGMDPETQRGAERELATFRRQLRTAYQRRANVLNRCRRVRWFRGDARIRAEAEALWERYRTLARTVAEQRPAQLRSDLDAVYQHTMTFLEHVEAAAVRRESELHAQAAQSGAARAAEVTEARTASSARVATLEAELEQVEGQLRAAREGRRWSEARALQRRLGALRRRSNAASRPSEVAGRGARRSEARDARLLDRRLRELENDRGVPVAASPAADPHPLDPLVTTGDEHAEEWDRLGAIQAAEEVARFRRTHARWIRSVTAEGRAVYDQPQVVVDAMNAVRSHPDQTGPDEDSHEHTHFYGGHHWEVAPEEILTDDSEYRQRLDHDMQTPRRRTQFPRIVDILLESAGGRRALLGGETDRVLLAALGAHYPGLQAHLDGRRLELQDPAADHPFARFLRERGYWPEPAPATSEAGAGAGAQGQ